ncbi:glycosyltransferase [Arcticibacter eurypsychrophilus]|uniref:glycosyltransferase n=1 Tax=Arcticibacter eurypsychrophilus TaxID=1434752 RepID=UPI00084E04D7|nr:glycosyltransferase [Arcticibacter eurypsychrophilus]
MNGKVLFITSGMCKGGAETQLIKVALFLKSLDYTVLIISLTPINEFELDYEKNGIPVHFLKRWRPYPFSNCISLYKTVKSYKPDVVIAFMFIAIIFARVLKKILNFPLISTIRIGVLPRKWYIPFLITSGLDDQIVYNSRASMKKFEEQKLVGKSGSVINNSITIPSLIDRNPECRHDNLFHWVCIAHFRWNKDYMTLFKAVALLRGMNFRLDIIGELNAQTWPFRVIEEFKIKEHIRILGFQKDASDYLQDADAFVLSSFSEGMPNALLEAMSYAKPVVVTDIDCNKELLDQAACGLLSRKENEYDLASKMLQMMQMTADERAGLGRRGRTHIVNHFAEDKVMNHWLALVSPYSLVKEQIHF